MERFMRIALWIFTFSVTLACCHPLPNYTCRKLHHKELHEFNIELMNETVTCEIESTFYIPNITEDACCISALECIFKELKGRALQECENKYYIGPGLTTLGREILWQKNNTTTTESTNLPACACEIWKEGSFREFLKGYKSLLERINAAAPQ